MKKIFGNFLAIAILFSLFTITASAEKTVDVESEDVEEPSYVDVYTATCPEHGNVEYVAYNTQDYEYSYGITKHLAIYTPYGYDETSQYDVVIIIPGLYDRETCLFGFKPFNYSDNFMNEVFDNVIYYKLARPMIVVCANWAACDDVGEQAYGHDLNQMANEINKDILPFLVENYALYAKDSSEEELIKNRNHVAIAGFSYGSMLVNDSLVENCISYCSNFCSISCGRMNMSDTAEAIDNSGYGCNLYFCAYGSNDVNVKSDPVSYNELLSLSETLVDKENAVAVAIQNEYHSIGLMDKALVMFMQLI